MNLLFDGRKLENTEIIYECGISNSSLLVQKKLNLDEIPGIQITYEPDCITFDDSSLPRTLMPCGHAVSSDTMTQILQSLIDSKKFEIKCPAQRGQIVNFEYTSNEPCDTV